MDHNQDNEIVIDEEELCEYINQKTGLDSKVITQVLEKEMDFLSEKGLLSEDKPDATEDGEKVYIDDEELIAFISSQTNISEGIVEIVLDTEMEFLDSKGLLE